MKSSIFFSLILVLIHFMPNAKAEIQSDDAFVSIEATMKALNHPQGVKEALNYLLDMPIEKLRDIQAPQMILLLDHIAMTKDIDLEVRLQTIAVLKRIGKVRTTILRDWKNQEDPKELLIDRELAEFFRALGRKDLLKGSTYSRDPEVRAQGAKVGVDEENLCALMNDPWAFVRIAALQGMGKMDKPPKEGICISRAMRDSQLEIAIMAIRMSAKLDDWDLNKKLISYFKEEKTPLPIREEILVTLGKRGDIEFLEQLMEEHLSQGSAISQIEEIAMATARGLAIENQKDSVLLMFKRTHLSRVRIECARLLLGFGNEYLAFILEATTHLSDLERAKLQRLLAPIQDEEQSDIAPKLEDEKEEEEELWLGDNPLLAPKNPNRKAIGETELSEEINAPKNTEESNKANIPDPSQKEAIHQANIPTSQKEAIHHAIIPDPSQKEAIHPANTLEPTPSKPSGALQSTEAIHSQPVQAEAVKENHQSLKEEANMMPKKLSPEQERLKEEALKILKQAQEKENQGQKSSDDNQ